MAANEAFSPHENPVFGTLNIDLDQTNPGASPVFHEGIEGDQMDGHTGSGEAVIRRMVWIKLQKSLAICFGSSNVQKLGLLVTGVACHSPLQAFIVDQLRFKGDDPSLSFDPIGKENGKKTNIGSNINNPASRGDPLAEGSDATGLKEAFVKQVSGFKKPLSRNTGQNPGTVDGSMQAQHHFLHH